MANLRSGPGIENPIVGNVQPSQVVTVTGCNPDCSWYELGTDIWIAAFLMDMVSSSPMVNATVESHTVISTEASLLPTITPSSRQAATVVPTSDSPTVAVAANLRGGPGTNFPIVGSTTPGQALEITGRTDAGDWYQLKDGTWIAAFWVSEAPEDIPVVAPYVP